MDFLEGLNDGQRAAAEHRQGCAIVCATAGSGKTETVTRRIAMLLMDGIDPDELLAVTFSRKGAKEMEERLARMGCPVSKNRSDMNGARVGTFHSLGYEIIRSGTRWSSYDFDDRERCWQFLKTVLGYKEMDWRDADITKVSGFISECKNALVEPEDAKHPDRRYVRAYARYEQLRDGAGLLTYDDLLYLAGLALRDDELIRNYWADKFLHVTVDEYQDTNWAQNYIMDVVSERARLRGGSLMVVGDDDQSIYEWRGAMPSEMIGFEKKYGAVRFGLEINYRSVPSIIAAANKVIAANQVRIEKSAVPNRDDAPAAVTAKQTVDFDTEASEIVGLIREMVADGAGWGDFAVLYRVNAQSRALEEEMLRNKIPHVVVGGLDFFSRREIADLLSYVRILANPENDKACRRAINRPFRYVGKMTIERMEAAAAERGVAFLEVAKNLRDWVPGLQERQYTQVGRFVRTYHMAQRLLEQLETDADNRGIGYIVQRIVDDTRYMEYLEKEEGSDTAENSRRSNVKEFVRVCAKFASVEGLLKHVRWVAAERKRAASDEKAQVVRLMTIHRSKGLEFPVVFLSGAMEMVLPHAKTKNVEEERRLFYVAITRARDRVFVFSPTVMVMGDELRQFEPSRFIAEAGISMLGEGHPDPWQNGEGHGPDGLLMVQGDGKDNRGSGL